MKFSINKNTISNALLILVVVLFIFPSTKVWLTRQLAFSPSIEKSEHREDIDSYNWNLKGLNTQSINFESFKGKVVFVNFWATWCPPCKAEMPMIQILYNDYKDKIEFVFVTDEPWDLVEKFYTKYNYNLPSYNSISAPPQKFSGTNSIPASYLIDRKGTIVVYEVGAAHWNSDKIRKLLDKLIER